MAGPDGRYRWVGYNVSLSEIVKTLSFHLGRPIFDGTKLTGTYDIDLKWGVDVAWLLERAGRSDLIEELPDRSPGPDLVRAVQDQLGLKLTSGRGLGDFVVIDHLETIPLEN